MVSVKSPQNGQPNSPEPHLWSTQNALPDRCSSCLVYQEITQSCWVLLCQLRIEKLAKGFSTCKNIRSAPILKQQCGNRCHCRFGLLFENMGCDSLRMVSDLEARQYSHKALEPVRCGLHTCPVLLEIPQIVQEAHQVKSARRCTRARDAFPAAGKHIFSNLDIQPLYYRPASLLSIIYLCFQAQVDI